MEASVLVIDDDGKLGRFIARDLARLGFETMAAESGLSGIEMLKARHFDAVVCDLNMPDRDGFEVLRFSVTLDPPPPFIMLTAYGSVSAAVEAMRHGAADFLEKPVKTEELSATIRAILNRKPGRARRSSSADGRTRDVVGSPLWLGPFLETLDRVAHSDATVLIDGETGTGKTAVAREIWKSSRRSDRPFVFMNCAALPDNLVESELFGHVRGAFTGAEDHLGKVAQAERGTLFLDEIGELKHELQAKLLHLLQERTYTPIGAGDSRRADVRFIAATNRDLRKEVEIGHFRQDLFFRLEVVSLTIPPLRERPADLPILVDHFCNRVRQRIGASPEFSEEAIAMLRRHDWPGNVRELENLIERFAVMHPPNTLIGPEHLPERIRGNTKAETETTSVPEFVGGAESSFVDLESGGLTLAEAVKNYEAGLIKAALDKASGNRSKAAKLLKVKRTTLIEKLKKLSGE